MKKNQKVQIMIERLDRVVTTIDYEEIKEIINENFKVGNIKDNKINRANIERCFDKDTGFAEKIKNGRSYIIDEEFKMRYLH